MPKIDISINEAIQTLKRSSLPTLVTEGSDDYIAFRRIEEDLAQLRVSVMPLGGRGKVLELFERRREIGRNDVAFAVDRDLWVFSAPPTEYIHRKVVFTDGYSIENDLYRDGDLEGLLTSHEMVRFRSELREIVSWYSFAVSRVLAGMDAPLADHPSRILDHTGVVCQRYASDCGYTGPDGRLYEVVWSDFRRLLRGKTLMDLILRRLSAPTRSTKFGRHQLLEIAAARRGSYYCAIRDHVAALFS